jgi:hypothetical protein
VAIKSVRKIVAPKGNPAEMLWSGGSREIQKIGEGQDKREGTAFFESLVCTLGWGGTRPGGGVPVESKVFAE